MGTRGSENLPRKTNRNNKALLQTMGKPAPCIVFQAIWVHLGAKLSAPTLKPWFMLWKIWQATLTLANAAIPPVSLSGMWIAGQFDISYTVTPTVPSRLVSARITPLLLLYHGMAQHGSWIFYPADQFISSDPLVASFNVVPSHQTLKFWLSVRAANISIIFTILRRHSKSHVSRYLHCVTPCPGVRIAVFWLAGLKSVHSACGTRTRG